VNSPDFGKGRKEGQDVPGVHRPVEELKPPELPDGVSDAEVYFDDIIERHETVNERRLRLGLPPQPPFHDESTAPPIDDEARRLMLAMLRPGERGQVPEETKLRLRTLCVKYKNWEDEWGRLIMEEADRARAEAEPGTWDTRHPDT
jgi:hypothetical protein